MQRDRLQALIGLAQPRAQEADGRQPHLGVVLDQLHHRPLRQRHGLHAADGGGPGRALAAVQGGDLSEDIAGPRVREGQLAAVAGEDRQPNASLQHQIDLTARVAAREDHLIGLEVDAPHAGGDGGPVRVGKGPEQGALSQQVDDCALLHGLSIPLAWTCPDHAG